VCLGGWVCVAWYGCGDTGGRRLGLLVKEAAQKCAESSLETHWGDGFPVDPVRVASGMGITVHFGGLPADTSGFIRKKPNRETEIFISEADSPLRQRFTCAHEIGHYVDRTVLQVVPDENFGFVDKRDGTVNDVHEFFANEFAGNLLMPAVEVRARFEQGWDTIRLAGHFGVSTAAMTVRLRRLELGYP